ncbi:MULTISPECIES: hypothetical protein [Streptomyces]|uniref:Uncharacterized protein n=1 Tax=Streptomyces griseocarneus TaxID=51201 RepID=A0ABX7RTQ3_9ACTN|nr:MULTISPECIES: hypothetical protein [Streptomyces]MBZ6474007.1 hypothetical protein [Streptomyces griseocarneus]QSY51387.1 hypothetical protein J3S04_11225 [Streptomyces griseocarneus]GHG66310.1 hypothetical protein GCM10018779_37820 [Streptomyces griseocarneus]
MTLENGKVSLYAANKLWVDARINVEGKLLIQGQDLNNGEYEYMLSVPEADIPKVVAALDGAPGDDVLELLAARGTEIVQFGEMRWLKSLGIEPGFSSYR